jgi:F-type H+-transporting ATPase subunit b
MDFAHDTNAWVAVSFAIFALIVWFKGRKAILGALDQRIGVIRAEIEVAQNLRLEAQKLFDDYEEKHMEAIQDAEHVVKVAEKQAIQIRKQAELDLADTIRIREKQLNERIERMKQTAMEEIQAYAADLAIKATAGIINEKLDDKDRSQLIDQAIANIGKNIH